MAINDSENGSNVISLVPAGKLRCFITGKLRQDRPEEHVRQRWARSLVEEYRYPREQIAIEFPIRMGSKKTKADIVIFNQQAVHKQDNIFIIVEVKRGDVLPKAKQDGIEQLKSYMSASSSCRYGLWVGAERQGFEKHPDGTILDGLIDIPTYGEHEPHIPDWSELPAAVELTTLFQRCHNYIFANQGLHKDRAFHEMLKLIFCKVYDETESTDILKFYIHTKERRSEAGQNRLLEERIGPLFEAVKQRYRYIFDANDEILLNKRVLAYVVSELQRISLLKTKTDVKGDAYEELVGENLRGDRGEYFTPRNVCDMAVRMMIALCPSHRVSNLKILDPCCGTGGFLVSFINNLWDIYSAQERKRGGTIGEIHQRTSARIKDICSQNLFGLDINPFLVRTCQMNLVMHGDGSANVYQADTLMSPSEWDNEDAARAIGHGMADIVLTNPPFGNKVVVDDPHILSQYELSTFGASVPRTSMPAEQLFIEAALKFLKPRGTLAIILPDSILNNPGLQFIREWLLFRTKIIASIDLPKETFATSGGVPNPSMLVIRKLTNSEIKLADSNAVDYDVFMAIPKTAGIDKRGQRVNLRTPEGLEIQDERGDHIKDDEIGAVAANFSRWLLESAYAGE